MPYVILTAPSGYAPNGSDEAMGLGFSANWGDRVDASDMSTTSPPRPTSLRPGDRFHGGPFRHVQMSQPASVHPQAIRENAVAGYRLAALHAGSGGQIGVALGHGGVGGDNAWADLAPVGALRVDIPMLEHLWRWREARPANRRPLSQQEATIEEIGAILRGRGRHRMIDRVDLVTCSVGGAQSGQHLLDWLHVLWRVPVRGLRGLLRFGGFHVQGDAEGSAWVDPPQGPLPPNHAFGRQFRDALIEGPGLWAHSRARRPPLTR